MTELRRIPMNLLQPKFGKISRNVILQEVYTILLFDIMPTQLLLRIRLFFPQKPRLPLTQILQSQAVPRLLKRRGSAKNQNSPCKDTSVRLSDFQLVQ